jgi:hypothetical protein
MFTYIRIYTYICTYWVDELGRNVCVYIRMYYNIYIPEKPMD